MEITRIEKHKAIDPQKDYRFSIIIPTWNNLKFLQLAVNSLKKNSHYDHQIIIHINEGIDGTLEWVKSQNLDFTYSPQNIGICYPLNMARQLAKTDYIVYMNDDMYAGTNWDIPFVDEISKLNDSFFFLSATLIEAKSTNPCVIGHNFGDSLSDFNEDRFLEESSQIPFSDWNGATWPVNLVHVDLWDMVGGYSPEYSPGFYSDPDFSKKLWDVGVRYFKGLSSSRFYHFPSQSTKRLKRKNNGRLTFMLKWGMSAKTFYKAYLKMGTPFDGPLQNIAEGQTTWAKLKQIKAIFDR